MSVAAASFWRVRHPTLQAAACAVVCVLILLGPTFWTMVSTWSRDATFAHGFAIPFISLWLFWQRRESLATLPIAPAAAGVWCCAGLTLVWLLADLADVQVVAQFAATALLPAVLWSTLGSEFVRRAAFPLAYLVFAVPFGDVFVPMLMRFTTEFTVAAVRLVGVPIFREGNLFSLPSGNFEVVKACSGVRYLIASVALGTLYAGISYRSWRRRAAFIALSIVVPIIANGLRAFGIVMIAHSTQMEYAVGIDHLIYGWLFFGVVMAVLFWIGNRFAEPNAAAGPSRAAPMAATSAAVKWSWRSFAAVFGILLAGVLAQPLIVFGTDFSARALLAAKLPVASERWRGPTPLQNEWRAAFTEGAAAARAVRYDGTSGSVLLFVRDYAGTEAAETGFTNRALLAEELGSWRVTQTGFAQPAAGKRVRTVQLLANDGARLEVWIWTLVNGQLTAAPLEATWLQLRSWLTLEHPVSTLVAVAAPGRQGTEASTVLTEYLQQYPLLLGTVPAGSSP